MTTSLGKFLAIIIGVILLIALTIEFLPIILAILVVLFLGWVYMNRLPQFFAYWDNLIEEFKNHTPTV